MEVKSGYKQTDAGILPEDWEVRTLGSITSVLTNGFVGTATSAYVEEGDGILYIQGYNVRENGFNFHGIKRVSNSFHLKNKKSCLQAGDLLTIQTGDIGVTAVVPPELAGANCHALIISRLKKQSSEPTFYCQYFNSERGRAAFKEIETGTTMKHLNCGDMKRLLLPSPTVEEQRDIAGALSDVDELLDALNRLVVKKRDLKRATMQQLLTGQTRLPGFDGEWEQVRLGDLFNFKNGLNKAKEFFGHGTPIVNYMDVFGGSVIRSSNLEGRVSLSKSELKNFNVQKGDVFFTRTSETTEEVGIAAVMLDEPDDTTFSGFVLRARPLNERLNDGFKAYCFSTPSVRKQIVSKASYTTRALTNGRILSEVLLRLPSLPEQIAIAAVLMDMDAELVVLEQQLGKSCALKQAMMQELLTGMTRLKGYPS